MVMRACVAPDNLNQVSTLGVGLRVLLRPRQEMQRGIMGGFADTGLGLGAGTRTQGHESGSPATGPAACCGGLTKDRFPASHDAAYGGYGGIAKVCFF